MTKIKFHDILQSSYGVKKYDDVLKRAGYNYDSMLSNHNQQVWFHPKKQKLLFNVAGSHNTKDFLITDTALALGRLKSTSRYQEADRILKEAKRKYSPVKTSLSGHSLASTIVNQIASKAGNDKVFAYNGGFTIGQKISPNKNFNNFRTNGDYVSGLVGLNPNIKTFDNTNFLKDFYHAHNVSNIQDKNIFV